MPAKRKPGRPPKHVGLATPMALKAVVNESDVRNLREGKPKPEGPVLQESPAVDDSPVGGGRVFGAATDPNAALVPATLPSPGQPEDTPVSFTDFLKRIAQEIAPAEFQEDGRLMTGMELLARKVFYSALDRTMQSQRARELVVDRLEGKAARANTVSAPDTTLEDQLDRAAVDLLNNLTQPPPDNEG